MMGRDAAGRPFRATSLHMTKTRDELLGAVLVSTSRQTNGKEIEWQSSQPAEGY